MWRAVLEALIPFLIPFALYAFWLAAMKRFAPQGQAVEAASVPVRAFPWILLSLAGVVLAFAVLVVTSNRNAMTTADRYAPARLSGGEVLPGGSVPR
jgi:surface polysaccharide O-acyltransferase-like enzyme